MSVLLCIFISVFRKNWVLADLSFSFPFAWIRQKSDFWSSKCVRGDLQSCPGPLRLHLTQFMMSVRAGSCSYRRRRALISWRLTPAADEIIKRPANPSGSFAYTVHDTLRWDVFAYNDWYQIKFFAMVSFQAHFLGFAYILNLPFSVDFFTTKSHLDSAACFEEQSSSLTHSWVYFFFILALIYFV